MDPASPYYQGYEIPLPEHRRPYNRPQANESFRSEREPERPIRRGQEVRKTASFHGGSREIRGNVPANPFPNDEFNRLYTGHIPVYAPQQKRDISFMLDQVKDEVKEREDSNGTSRKKSRSLSTVGTAGVQFTVGFFYAATQITLITFLVTSPHLTENVNPNLHRIVFLVFSALASAACAVLVPTARYRKLMTSGAILLIFSCLSASLVTSGRFMFLPYGVLAGSAHGILRTTSLVAATDIGSSRRVTSVSVATLGHSTGGIVGTFVYYYFMSDYLTAGAWPNNFRILELSAVVALLLGAVVRRPVGVTAQARASIVISDIGFHSVAVFYAIAFVAIGVLHYLIPLMPVVRMFSFSQYETFFNPLFALYCGEWLGSLLLASTGACCGKGAGRMCLFVGGVVVFLLGVAVMPHKPAYGSFWAYMGLSLGVGFATAFAQVLVSVGVAKRTGGVAVGVCVSLLMFWHDMGTLFGIVAVDQLNSDFSLDAALYMSGGFLLVAGLALIVCHFTVKPLIQFRKPFDSDSETSSNGPREAGITNPGMGRWDNYEYDYRYMH